jgi:hypothetical protein
MLDNIPLLSSSNCATTAAELNKNHARKYPTVKNVAVPKGGLSDVERLLRAAASRIVGAALGNIIAIIITHHIVIKTRI